MLRLIFTALATLALLFIGALWLAAQPSGSGVRKVVAPVLDRGFEIVAGASKRAVMTASRDLVFGDDDSSRLTLTPTASGVWEPEPEPSALFAGGGEDAPPEEIALVPPTSRPFRESTLDESDGAVLVGSGGNGPVAEPAGLAPGVRAGRVDRDEPASPDQDDWAALIRRMLALHSRVSRFE